MSTSSNVSPLIKTYMSCVVLASSNPESDLELELLADLEKELYDCIEDQNLDMVSELIGLSVGLTKFSMSYEYVESESLSENFESAMGRFSLWLESCSTDRTVLDSIDMGYCVKDWAEDRQLEGGQDVGL